MNFSTYKVKQKKQEALNYYEEKYSKLIKVLKEAPINVQPELMNLARHYKKMINKFRKDLGRE